jgi:hypothetical protein
MFAISFCIGKAEEVLEKHGTIYLIEAYKESTSS